MKYSNIKPQAVTSLTLVAIFFVMTGCAEYRVRQDAIAPSFGNAMATNTALQTVDPWPRYVERTHVHTDGAKATNAIDAYRAPPETGTSGGNTISLVPVPSPSGPKP